MPTATAPTFHLAQINVARLIAPLDDPRIKEFRDFLDPVNQLGADSPGFVWQYKSEDGSASSYQDPLFPDPMIIVNFTVWESYETLHDFVYKTVHSYFLKQRKRWFAVMDSPHVALWWIPAGHVPSLEEAKEKLATLAREGSGPKAFDLRRRYTANGQFVR